MSEVHWIWSRSFPRHGALYRTASVTSYHSSQELNNVGLCDPRYIYARLMLQIAKDIVPAKFPGGNPEFATTHVSH